LRLPGQPLLINYATPYILRIALLSWLGDTRLGLSPVTYGRNHGGFLDQALALQSIGFARSSMDRGN